MTSLTGAPKATSLYPRFVWNGTTIDFEDPLIRMQPELVPVVGQNIASSGLREVLHERTEEFVIITTPVLRPAADAQLDRMIRNWAALGNQAEVYLDRFLRACWGFEGQPEDNNGGNGFSLRNSSESVNYAALSEGLGFVLPSTGIVAAALVSTLPGGAGNVFLASSEGTIVLAFKPDWAAGASERVLLDCFVDISQDANRLTLRQRSDGVFQFVYAGANGAETILETTPAWAANTEHTVMVQWKALSDLQMKLDTTLVTAQRYPIVASGSRIAGTGLISGQTSGTANGTETLMDSAPDRVTLGTDASGLSGRATGTYGLLSLYQLAYGLPNVLKTFHMPWRTYYPKAEFVDSAFRPARLTSGRQLFTYELRIRAGR